MAPQKGKLATKGQKQIVEDNAATLSFYRNMVYGANGVYLVVMTILGASWTLGTGFLLLLALCSYVGSYQFMKYMSTPKYGPDEKTLLDSGSDLNMEGGLGESAITAPIRGFYLVWINFLGPWFFQSAPEQPEVSEKKQKKMERRMKRLG
ncbi:transmembrane protein 208 [Diaphorina citri]|uniref:Transmembrane protein 208 n=1 Tax=Diaphorina citri TaxID=121845 RepID=A0A1S3DI45_DIACI|nr:transmembrane protein 208 [Diaphorina citri]